MDTTIVNIALPKIHVSLGGTFSLLQWIFDAYLLVLASFLLFSGALADRVGHKKIFMLGLVLFGGSSGLCALANSPLQLILLRALQGLGGSMLNPVAMSILTDVFVKHKERAQAIGIWGSVSGISLAAGPIIGGFLVNFWGWRSIFLVNVPIALVALGLTSHFVSGSQKTKGRPWDTWGQISMIIFLGLLTILLIELPNFTNQLFPLGIVLLLIMDLFLFLIREKRVKYPLINLRYFKSIPFTTASLLAICGFTIFNGFLFLNTIYLQNVIGLKPLMAGVYTLPLALICFITAPISGKIIGNYGTKVPMLLCGIGMLMSTICIFFSKTTIGWPVWLAYIFLGIGFGMLNSPITITAVSGMPASEVGVAAAIPVTCKQIGSSLGIALPSALSSLGTLNISSTKPSILLNAINSNWLFFSIFGGVIIAFALYSHTKKAANSAKKIQQTFTS